MKVTILYDNQGLEGFQSGWGFSCLIENAEMVLFDTGDNGRKLLFNFNVLGIPAGDIDKVVLSHNHWDHTGGLKAFQKVNRNAEVIPPKKFTQPTRIAPGLYTTGALGMWPKEQALVAQTDKGNLVITGCAHPGLDKIIAVAGILGSIYGVIGGFHGYAKWEKLAGIRLIAPCHCTRYVQQIRQMYPSEFREVKAGSVLEI